MSKNFDKAQKKENREPLKPMLFSVMKGYSGSQLVNDIIAGVIVAIIALPLSIALALASGVGPQEGLYTAIVAGFIISFLGGSRVQIAGPTAAFATIVAGIVATKGTDGLMLATVMAGILLIVMGLFRLGSLIRFIPYTITTGFTAGIAVTILLGQFKDFFGVTYKEGVRPIETMEKMEAFIDSVSTISWQAVVVGCISLVILFVWQKIRYLNKIPGSFVAVVVGILLVKFLFTDVNTIASLNLGKGGLPTFRLPSSDALSFSNILSLLPNAVTIAVLAAIESLLSCVVADSMVGSKHRSNMELVAQGAGNIGSALFGGIPATGAIARTAANIKNGGRTPIAGMVHAVVLLIMLLVLMPFVSLIPMPVIAAILFQVAYNMCQWRPFVHICKTAPKSDILVLVTTFVLTVVFDLVVAIAVGLVMACVLLMKRMAEESGVRGWKYRTAAKEESTKEEAETSEELTEESELRQVPEQVRVYEISGPMFFGAAGKLAEIELKSSTKVLILRMGGVPAIDITAMNGLNALADRCKVEGVTVILSHVNSQPMKSMTKAGFVQKIGENNFLLNINVALDYAEKLCADRAVAE